MYTLSWGSRDQCYDLKKSLFLELVVLTNEARDLAVRGFIVSPPNCNSASSLLTGTMIGQ